MFLGPVFWMELRARARRKRFFVARALLTAGLATVVCIPYVNFLLERPAGWQKPNIKELAELGQNMFLTYAIAQFAMLGFLAPAYCAGAITADRERRVLELVFATRLSNLELIAGKFLIRVLDLLVLLVAGIPALFICMLLGGVMWDSLAAAMALTVVMLLFIASLSLLVSIGARRTLSAIVMVYMILLIAWLAMPTLASMSMGPAGPTSSWQWTVLELNPASAIIAATLPASMGFPIPNAHWIFMTWYGGTAAVLFVVDVLFARRFGLWASRERVKRPKESKPKTRQRAARQVWNNPVAWREVRTIAVHRRMRWARILTLILLIMFSAPLWITWLVDLLEGQAAMSSDMNAFCFVITATAVMAWVLMTLQGAVSFAFEREHDTLDALLTTPLTSFYILLGKLAGILRSSAFALAFPIAWTLLAWGRSVITPRAALLSLAIIVAGCLLAATWGLLWSVVTGRTLKALSYATVAVLVVCIGLPAASEIMMDYSKKYDWLRCTMLSPTTNLSYGVFETGQSRSRFEYYAYEPDTPWGKWGHRVGVAYGYVALNVALAAMFMALATVRLERHYRIDPWLPVAQRLDQRTGPRRVAWRSMRFFVRHWIIACTLLLSLTATSLYAYLQWLDARAVRKLLAEISARGEPMTPAELYAFYPRSQAQREGARLWLDAGKVLEESKYPFEYGVPYHEEDRGAPPGRAWENLVTAEEFLEQHAETIRQLHAAAEKEARFEIRWENGIGILLPHTQVMRPSARALNVEAHVAAHRGDAHGAAEAFHAAFAAGRATSREPLFVSQLVHWSIAQMTLHELLIVLPSTEFSEDDLRQIERDLLEMDIRDGLRRAMLGERATSWTMFDDIGWIDYSGSPDPSIAEAIDARLWRDRDRRDYLEIMAELVDCVDRPWPEMQDATGDVSERVERLGVVPRSIISAHGAMVTAAIRTETLRQLALAAIAVERFRRQQGRPPATLEELTPQWWATASEDPFVGGPLGYRIDDDGQGYVLFSRAEKSSVGAGENLQTDAATGAWMYFRNPPVHDEPKPVRLEWLRSGESPPENSNAVENEVGEPGAPTVPNDEIPAETPP